MISTFVRDTSGDLLVTIDHETAVTLPSDEYYIELTTTVKTYLRVNSSLDFDLGEDELTLSFGDETAVEIGARSAHTRPAGTITTTTDPDDVMAAVSSFGSALKTTSPERSFPTLRGHPPTVEFGDELHVPEDMQPPETGVTIEVPPAFEFIFPVPPLAYYLGATVVPGDTPRIVTEQGTYPLTHPKRGFEGEVARVLKQTLFFDCLTRTEGLFRLDLHERRAVETLVDLDFETLYDASISDRLRAYLDVPFSVFEDTLPTWRLSVQYDRAGKRGRTPVRYPGPPDNRRGDDGPRVQPTVTSATDIAAFTRSTEVDRRYPSESIPNEEYVVPPKTPKLSNRRGSGTGAPVGGNKLVKSGFEHRVGRDGSADDPRITIVCNDPKMLAEYRDTLYGPHDDLPFDVTVDRNCSTAGTPGPPGQADGLLPLHRPRRERGVRLPRRPPPTRRRDDVNVDMFLLNACRSYVPGKRLVEAGSIGGIVTYSEIGNAGCDGHRPNHR